MTTVGASWDANFIPGGGEMGERIRALPWQETPLGPPPGWPPQLRTLVDLLMSSTQAMFMAWGPERIWFYNDAFIPILGAKHPGALGRPSMAVWAEAREVLEPMFDRVYAGEAIHNPDFSLMLDRHGKLERAHFSFSYTPVRGEGGIEGLFGVCVETTAQITAARELASSRASLQLAMSGGGVVGIWDWDVVNDRVTADVRFARLYGVDPERAKQGAPVTEFFANIHPDDRARVEARVAEVLRSGDEFNEEYRLVQADGSIRWVIALGRCALAEDGTPLHFPGAGFDITERREAEERLRLLNIELERKVIERAQARGRTWQVSPDLMGALNAKGYFETSNPAWLSVLGWSEDEVASMSIFELLHPDDVERTRAGFELTQQGQPAIRFPNRYRCKDGSYRWISWVGVPEDGYVYCSGRDITEEKQAEGQLADTQDALRQAQKMEAVGQLTGGIAHDFNNLLAGIMGSLDLVTRRIAAKRFGEVQKFIDGAQESAKRAASLTQRLLAFSRQQPLRPEPVSVNTLIAGLEELVRRTIGSGIQLDFELQDAVWPISVDPSQLENAVLNLCINARDAMPEGGAITFHTANHTLGRSEAAKEDLAPGDYVCVRVSDTGAGMSPDVAARAFDPFFTTKPLGQGTGLGLSMIYGFAKQSGGQVSIASQLGAGTAICLCLPRYIAP